MNLSLAEVFPHWPTQLYTELDGLRIQAPYEEETEPKRPDDDTEHEQGVETTRRLREGLEIAGDIRIRADLGEGFPSLVKVLLELRQKPALMTLPPFQGSEKKIAVAGDATPRPPRHLPPVDKVLVLVSDLVHALPLSFGLLPSLAN